MLVMQQGVLAIDGAPGQVMRPDVIARYFGFEAEAVNAGGRNWLVPRV
jgi:ABC-type cobalamin transport system ATPase subunit